MSGLEQQPVTALIDDEPPAPGQQARQQAALIARQVLGQNQRQRSIRRDRLEHTGEGLEATGGGPHAGDQKRGREAGRARGGRRLLRTGPRSLSGDPRLGPGCPSPCHLGSLCVLKGSEARPP